MSEMMVPPTTATQAPNSCALEPKAPEESSLRYVVGALKPWTAFSVASPFGNIPLTVGDGSCGVMLVYPTREAAEREAHGHVVLEMVVGEVTR